MLPRSVDGDRWRTDSCTEDPSDPSRTGPARPSGPFPCTPATWHQIRWFPRVLRVLTMVLEEKEQA
eukprot:682232-Hanusia_phi.AAC.2